MTLDEAIKSLMALQAKLAAYGHAMGLLFYDGATTAPKGTAANRGQTMSILSEEHYKLTTGGETVARLALRRAHHDALFGGEFCLIDVLRYPRGRPRALRYRQRG